MPTLYVATLGQRPEAITVAFDRLNEQQRSAGARYPSALRAYMSTGTTVGCRICWAVSGKRQRTFATG